MFWAKKNCPDLFVDSGWFYKVLGTDRFARGRSWMASREEAMGFQVFMLRYVTRQFIWQLVRSFYIKIIHYNGRIFAALRIAMRTKLHAMIISHIHLSRNKIYEEL